MTHPITPPLELVQQWGHNANLSGVPHNDEHWAYEQHIATRSAQWGADQELEACLKLVEIEVCDGAYELSRYIRDRRRPKPPSLKAQALAELVDAYDEDKIDDSTYDTIRRALEQLDD
jgi:hypothetical protein